MGFLVKILRQYQRDGRDFLLSTDHGGCLFMEMRLGKTLTAIRFTKRLLWDHPDGKNSYNWSEFNPQGMD